MGRLQDEEFNPLKMLHHVDRLKALALHHDIAPVTVEVDPVAFCNHNCPWCVDPVHVPAAMPYDMYAALVKELSSFDINGHRVEGIVLKGGGEPTLHPDFGHMVTRAAEYGFAVGVVTNGSRLTHWSDVLADRASYVRVSIDGPTPDSHARIHGSKDFDRILAGVSRLVASRAGRRHPVIGLTFAIDIRTVDLTSQAIALAETLGVDYALLRPPFFEEVGRAPTMSLAEAKIVRQRLKDAASAYQGPLLVMIGNWSGDVEQQTDANNDDALAASGRRDFHLATDLPIEHRTGRCLASPLLAVVTAIGEVYGCCNLRAIPTWSFGRLDYPNGVGFAHIWAGPQRETTLTRMHRTDCITHCTHPLSRYNEAIEVLQLPQRPHSQFV